MAATESGRRRRVRKRFIVLEGVEKFYAASFGPEFQTATDKSNMPSVGRRLKGKMPAFFGDFYRKAGFGKKGVVECANEEAWNSNGREVGLAAGAGPVIAGIFEAVERCGVAIVEFGKGFDLVDAGEVETAREDFVFKAGFFLQTLHETGHVNSVAAFTEAERAGGEITRGGEGDGGFDFWVGFGALLSEVFEDDVSSEAEADEGEFLVAL